MSTQDERYAFIAEWYDPNAALIRRYQFLYYPKDNTIEMFDLKNRRHFLKRTKSEQITLNELYIGSTINVHARQLNFVDYGDEYTRKKLSSKKERTLGMIKPDSMKKMGEILDLIFKNGFLITKMKKISLSRNEALEFYQEHQSKMFFNTLIQYITSGPVMAFELMGENAVEKWRNLLGPTDSAEARSEAPYSIRARFGTGGIFFQDP
ncbi:nucleoside diphosphate kinase 7 [Lingula anatina]|uniref:Nucleoside diphosphate kinase 7 n=1 Tax=Lingula anatina TaxID=7574 RepID=A0A1S3JXU8_LINAN|nr:nucleoside diphosphate kinase 7 [Lingula anatina]|eukprot:XP_013415203.1 nucleoside diphosphate kinase 7 [Lingula anatina]